MTLLAFDTCFGACSVAVLAKGRLTARFEEMRTGHAERLMPMIAETMAAAGLAFAELERIAVTVGPGSFTGVRVGIAAARGLRLALAKPVATATSLELATATARTCLAASGSSAQDARRLAVAIEARRGQVYVEAPLTGRDDARPATRLLAVDEAAAMLGRGPIVVVGSAAAALAAAIQAQGGTAEAALPDLQPDARHLPELVASRPDEPGPPHPLYLREADAKPQTQGLRADR
ncbi:MAG: tRNA (adenosine(37)-N6)-threonylcarbamoyltransferase complex dimerization subunit type 1 TsaB [Hyphomicrobiaceae bacterium]|nr:tRNA (adenosine(37)-N6)-threonylcarbamoyltransferase complex dimerization subunit type 1 TsaB [Hyphomicrobiaceae bacterium]